MCWCWCKSFLHIARQAGAALNSARVDEHVAEVTATNMMLVEIAFDGMCKQMFPQ